MKNINNNMERLLQVIDAQIASELSFGDVAKTVLDNLDQIIPFKIATIQIIHGETREIIANRGLSSRIIKNLKFTENISQDPLTRRIIEATDLLYLSSVQNDPEFSTNLLLKNANSWMGVPFMIRGLVTGVLTIGSDQLDTYDQLTHEILKTYANQTAIALGNCLILEKLRRQQKELEDLRHTSFKSTSFESNIDTTALSAFQSVFISYGAPDQEFAEHLENALSKHGANTFIFSKHAIPGQKLHRVMREGVNNYDRVVLICSENSLDRSGVLNEIEETLQREAREGGGSILLPITLDEYVFSGSSPNRVGNF